MFAIKQFFSSLFSFTTPSPSAPLSKPETPSTPAPLEDDPELWFKDQKGSIVIQITSGSMLYSDVARIVASYLIRKEEYDVFGPEQWLKHYGVRISQASVLPPAVRKFWNGVDPIPETDGTHKPVRENYYPPILCPKLIIREKNGEQIEGELTLGLMNKLSKSPKEGPASSIYYSKILSDFKVENQKWIVPRKRLIARNCNLKQQENHLKRINSARASAFDFPCIIDIAIYSSVMHKLRNGMRVLSDKTAAEGGGITVCREWRNKESDVDHMVVAGEFGAEDEVGCITIICAEYARDAFSPKRGVQIFKEFST